MSLLRAACPAAAKPVAMPADDGIRLHHHQRLAPVLPTSREDHPKESVACPEVASRRSMEGRQFDQQIRTLVREMATANPLWGAPRIHGELRTLGVHVSERTVSRLLEPHTRPSPQTWKTFLTNHLASAASMDFFTVPTLTGRVLFVVVVLSHVRRRIVHFNITAHPTAEWTISLSDAP